MLIEACREILNLFYPDSCSCCDSSLTYNEKVFCLNCLNDLPFSDFSEYENNPLEKKFYGRVFIHSATSLLFFSEEGKTQKLIHKLKYNNQQEIGYFMGCLLSEEMISSNRFESVDYVVPVPLHRKKFIKRGYNQLTEFGKCLAKKLQANYSKDFLIKTRNTKTQTGKMGFERWKNVTKSFELIDLTKFENSHVLLIDDVITTGSTIEACCNELLKTKNIVLSIATIAHLE